MGGKKNKKGDKKKKPPKEKKEGDGLPAVDKQFFELTIADLNNKLVRLRSHNSKVEEQIEELEAKLKQLQEDKSDITAYLNRILAEKVEIIQELEEKLTELNNVRGEENQLAKKHQKELEGKYKAMEEQLTSEIKLLTGKLNSLEEFRIQRDEILNKFEVQEAMLKDQQKKHEEKLYEMDKTNIIGKDLLKKEVEQRLLKLSNEFTKSSEIRVAAHTQRLVRENIALNNEMDRMFVTHNRLQEENAKFRTLDQELRNQCKVDRVENMRLARTCQKQVLVIEKLTKKVEDLLDENESLGRISGLYKKMRRREADDRTEVKYLRGLVADLEEKIRYINNNRTNLRLAAIQNRKELDRILEVLRMLKHTLNELIVENQQVGLPSTTSKRDNLIRKESLLADLIQILTNLDNIPITSSLETVLKINTIYNQGELGIVPSARDREAGGVTDNDGKLSESQKIDITGSMKEKQREFSGFDDDEEEADDREQEMDEQGGDGTGPGTDKETTTMADEMVDPIIDIVEPGPDDLLSGHPDDDDNNVNNGGSQAEAVSSPSTVAAPEELSNQQQ